MFTIKRRCLSSYVNVYSQASMFTIKCWCLPSNVDVYHHIFMSTMNTNNTIVRDTKAALKHHLWCIFFMPMTHYLTTTSCFSSTETYMIGSITKCEFTYEASQDWNIPRCTYSRYLAQYAGSDMAMKQQLVRMVHMMNKLNNVSRLRNMTFQLDWGSTAGCVAAGGSQWGSDSYYWTLRVW